MSDIRHRRIGSNWTHRRWKGNSAPMADVPNLQRRVYDIAAAGTECNQTQAHCAREAVMKCPAWRHHCGECSSLISGQWAPLQLSSWPLYAVKSACNPIPVVMQCVVGQTVAAYWLSLYSDIHASFGKRMQLNAVSCIAYTVAFKRSL